MITSHGGKPTARLQAGGTYNITVWRCCRQLMTRPAWPGAAMLQLLYMQQADLIRVESRIPSHT